MNRFSKITAAAMLAGFSFVAAGFAALPSRDDADVHQAVATARIVPAERIDISFKVSLQAERDGLESGRAQTSRKGNLLVKAGCGGQYWPYVESGCLVLANGRGLPAVRTITLGYQASETSSVLIRLPAGQIASR